MEYIYLPLAIFLMIICPRMVLYGMFYNKYTRQWEGKKWQYYTAYAILQAICFFLCTLPFMTDTYIRIRDYYQLATGQEEYVEWRNEKEELPEDLPKEEYILVYAVKKTTSAEKLTNEILPQIVTDRMHFSNFLIWGFDYDYRIEDYRIKYDIENKIYKVYLDQKIAAEIKVKNTLFVKKIYFHGYKDVYSEYPNKNPK